jgi:hypothetical protein
MAILLRRGFIPDASFLIDTLTSKPLVAYSTRQLSSTYHGNAMTAVSSQGATLAVGFTGGGDLDTSGFSGAFGAHDVGIMIWNDQSGNGIDADNSTTHALSPGIRSSTGTFVLQNNHPAAQIINSAGANFGTETFFASTQVPFGSGQSAQNVITLAQVFVFLSLTSNNMTDSTGANRILVAGTSSTYQMFAGSGPISGGTTDTSVHAMFAFFNGASSSMQIDATAGTIPTGNAGTNPLWGGGSEIIGNSTPATQNFVVAEFMFFPGVLGAGDITTLRNSWRTYWGTL